MSEAAGCLGDRLAARTIDEVGMTAPGAATPGAVRGSRAISGTQFG